MGQIKFCMAHILFYICLVLLLNSSSCSLSKRRFPTYLLFKNACHQDTTIASKPYHVSSHDILSVIACGHIKPLTTLLNADLDIMLLSSEIEDFQIHPFFVVEVSRTIFSYEEVTKVPQDI